MFITSSSAAIMVKRKSYRKKTTWGKKTPQQVMKQEVAVSTWHPATKPSAGTYRNPRRGDESEKCSLLVPLESRMTFDPVRALSDSLTEQSAPSGPEIHT